MRAWCQRLGWLCWAAIVLLLLLAHLIGQSWPPLGMLIYAPPQMWLIFLALLAAAGWWLSRVLFWTCMVTAMFYAGPVCGYRTHRPDVQNIEQNSASTLRVVSANRGDHHGHSIADFVLAQQPDLVAMQDSIFAYAWTPGAAEYAAMPHQSRVSEFLLLSRFPITRTELLITKLPPVRGTYRAAFKAARFQIDFHGQPVAVYNVHLPSPRQNMHQLGHAPSVQSLEAMYQYWRDHAFIIRDLMTRMEAETLPTLVLGDWNQPSVGPLYRRLTGRFHDAHMEAGLGYGWSFPGDWWTIFTDGQAWMRLDLVLSSRHWQVLRSEVEPESDSQHCAVGAVLRLK